MDLDCSKILRRIDDFAYEDDGRGLNDPFDARVPEFVERIIEGVIREVRGLCAEDLSLAREVDRGKMFGLLVVRGSGGEVGYLVAFSGAIEGRYELEGFVPAIFDYNNSQHYKVREQEIVSLSERIRAIEGDPRYIDALCHLRGVEESASQELERCRSEYQLSKRERAEQRRLGTDEEQSRLDRESQHQKGELRRVEQRLKSEIEQAEGALSTYRNEIERLREERRSRSQSLQWWIYDNFKLLNGRGESRSLLSLFEESISNLPPTGAGECAAPKLLHYAFREGYVPLAIGEFWIGGSTKSGEVRHEGATYGACRGRCYPILTYMLQGVNVATKGVCEGYFEIEIIYEDGAIVVVDKPSGLLSVDGLGTDPSVESLLRERYRWVRAVHRLDQDTSGILILAKALEHYTTLQQEFATGGVEKKYVAVVDGVVESPQGEITLPLRPDPLDRPRQVVDPKQGRSAHTLYEVLERYEDCTTRLALFPKSGRTHQLRVHCAYVGGLNAPIVGDRLYGVGGGDQRLALHASQITFTHPATDERVTLHSAIPF